MLFFLSTDKNEVWSHPFTVLELIHDFTVSRIWFIHTPVFGTTMSSWWIVSWSVWGDPFYLLISSGLKSDIWTMALACFWDPFAWTSFSTCSPLRQCLLSLMLRCIFLAATNRWILVLVCLFVLIQSVLCLSVVIQGSLVFRITIERFCSRTMSHSCQMRPCKTKTSA